MDLQLRGRLALVTGASSGIGQGIAEALAAEGCDLHIVARSGDKLARVAAEITSRYAVRVNSTVADLSDPQSTTLIAQRCPSAGILVNCAGAVITGRLEEIEITDLRTSWEVKVFSYIALSKVYLAVMREAGKGVVLNVIGRMGHMPNPNHIGPSMANAALIAFTRAAGIDSMRWGVRVIGLSPGPVQTPRLEHILKRRADMEFGDASRFSEYFRDMPAGRPARVDEIADVAAFLVSDRAAYISATVVAVDGGMEDRAPGRHR